MPEDDDERPTNPEPANRPDMPNPGDPGPTLPAPRIGNSPEEDLPRTSETPLGL